MDTHDPSVARPAPGAAGRPKLLDRRRNPYEPAIGPRLKIVLAFIFACVALLGATGVYLTAIRLLEWGRAQTYTNQFTLWMFIAHSVVGVLLVLPFLAFGFTHLATARHRPNRLAVRLGIGLFSSSIVVGLTGLALIQLEGMPQLPTGTTARAVMYALHVLAPLVAVAFYVLHRRAGPEIKWQWGIAWGVAVGAFVLVMGAMHSQDPRQWYAQGPKEGEKYFEPSKTRTVDGNFIPAAALMMDTYCLKCHADIYHDWFHSAHHFSSFNNPPYRFSVRETRKVSLERDGNTRPSRWCAGCHDPVPFLSGAFDDPNFDDVHHPTAHAGITCTVCHAITNVNSTIGNGDYTIEEPQHYPFAYSQNPLLQWLNNQVVKAKPDFHKKMFLKPFHRSAEFCSTCHKVSLPMALNHYKEFLRGQNHYDTFLLSGVSGHGARSFYYPPEAKTRCAECHMPLEASTDFGSRDFDGSGTRKVHGHLFVGANTGLPWLLSLDPIYKKHAGEFQKVIQAQTDFLRGTDPEGKDRKLRIDLFGLKEGGTIDGKLLAPLRPELPALKPGATYLVEVVIRTLNIGHPFPQGTTDSNEIWVDFQARSGDRIIGRNGGLSGPDDTGRVDEWSHFVNVLLLDRNGNRINRRNPQDIFTPLYDHQIPPGAGQVVHYSLKVPEDVKGPVELKVRLRYRKFDFEYLSLVYEGDDKVPKLPIVDICEDQVTLPVAGVADNVPAQTAPIKPVWQRWNDYGIGCYLEGGAGSKKGELRQAEEAFRKILAMEDKAAHGHGYLNLARVYFDEGRLREAVEALNKARATEPPAPWWTVAWFIGLVNAQNGHLDEAIANFEQILDAKNQPWDRRFDFTQDFVVINELASTLFKRAQQEDDPAARNRFLQRAVEQYERTLRIESENLDAHYGLAQCYVRLGEVKAAADGPTPATEAELLALGKTFADGTLSRERRLQAAAQLVQGVPRFGAEPAKPDQPKLPALQSLIAQCRQVFGPNSEEELRDAAASVLGQLYRQTHAIYKPDDNAKDRTIRLYREKHPAADHASQAIVIYPANRAGAPGSWSGCA
jgi:tetratricopeptide (TPR) repeat protein